MLTLNFGYGQDIEECPTRVSALFRYCGFATYNSKELKMNVENICFKFTILKALLIYLEKRRTNTTGARKKSLSLQILF